MKTDIEKIVERELKSALLSSSKDITKGVEEGLVNYLRYLDERHSIQNGIENGLIQYALVHGMRHSIENGIEEGIKDWFKNHKQEILDAISDTVKTELRSIISEELDKRRANAKQSWFLN